MNTANATQNGSKEFIAMMAILMSVVAITIDAVLPALGIIGQDLQVSHPNQAQYIIGCIFLGMACGELCAGPLSDAWGRKKILYIGLFLYLLGSVLCLFSNDISSMLVGRFIQGFGVAGPYISVVSIVRDKYSGRSMARVMSLVMMIFIMVPTIAPALGQGIILLSSWRYIFVLYVLYALGVSIWVYMRLEETLPESERIAFKTSNIINGAKEIFGNRVTMCYTLAMGLVFGALSGDLHVVQQIFQVQYNVGDMFAVYFGLQALSMGAASLLNSRLVERLGMRYLCLRAALMLIASTILILLVYMVMPVEFWMFFLYGVVMLFCVGLLFGNLNALAMEPMGHIAGTAASVIGCLTSIIGVTFGTIIGQMYDGTLLPVLMGFLILGILAFIAMLFETSGEHEVLEDL